MQREARNVQYPPSVQSLSYQCKNSTHDRGQHYHNTNNAIQNPNAPQIETNAKFVHKISNHEPPCERSAHNGQISQRLFVGKLVREDKRETGEQTDKQQNNERIGQCNENAVTKLRTRLPLVAETGRILAAGLLRKVYTPKQKSITLPISWK